MSGHSLWLPDMASVTDTGWMAPRLYDGSRREGLEISPVTFRVRVVPLPESERVGTSLGLVLTDAVRVFDQQRLLTVATPHDYPAAAERGLATVDTKWPDNRVKHDYPTLLGC